jgi:hypothetical protein
MQGDEGAIETARSSSLRVGRVEGVRVDTLPRKAASTREPLFSDTSRSADRPPKRTATLPKSVTFIVSS